MRCSPRRLSLETEDNFTNTIKYEDNLIYSLGIEDSLIDTIKYQDNLINIIRDEEQSNIFLRN